MLSLLFISCSGKKQIEINIPELKDGQVLIGYQDPSMIETYNQKEVCKGELKDGRFSINLDSLDFKGKVYECVVTIINKDKQFACQTPMPIQKDKIITLTITGVNDYMKGIAPLNVSYSGSKYAEEFSDFWDQINKSFVELFKSNDNKIYQKQVDIYKAYLKKNPQSGYAYATIISEMNMIKDDNNPIIKYCEELSAQKTDNEWLNYLSSYYKTRKLKQISGGTLVFTAQNIKGDTITERNINGKLILVDFWASWCKPCIETMPKLEALYNKYHSKGLEIISISVDTNPNDWAKYMSKHSFKWLSLLGNGKELTQRYDFQYIPHILVVDSKGKVLQSGIEADKLDAFIESYLKE